MGNSIQRKHMKKMGCKGLSCFLTINFVCLAMAGCGVGSGNGQGSTTGSLVGGSADSANDRFDSSNGSSADGSDSSSAGSPANSPEGRQVLTVAAAQASRTVVEKISAYNEGSESYFIEIKEYGDARGTEGAGNWDTQLTLDILSGKGPDMVIWDSYSYSPALASEKLMADLYDLMEGDQDFHKADYYENILQAFEMNGGLYMLPASFSVETVYGKAEEIGTGRDATESWEVGEMIDAFENSPHVEWLTMNHSREIAFRFVCQGCLGNYVDWSSGECSFDSPAFVKLLELSETFPAQMMFEPDFSYCETLRSGRVLWEPSTLSSPWNVANDRTNLGDEDVCWPGYPVADGEKDLGSGVAVPGGESFSICRNSRNQEAAWDVIKGFLTEEAQREVEDIPLMRSVSEERIQDALTTEYETVNGVTQEKVKYQVIVEGEETVNLSCITEEDAEVYRSIIENTRRSYCNDPGMMDIIMEEVRAYFEKDKDAAAVADIIQNRVSIYVGERIK